MKSKYLVCYDICDPGRLNRVFKSVKAIGVHLQYSVFHCSLTWPELQDLKVRLSRLIDPNEDDIRIYPLPEGEKIIAIGKGGRVPAGVEIFVK
jgi:CRISPR-associated protein Cas2